MCADARLLKDTSAPGSVAQFVVEEFTCAAHEGQGGRANRGHSQPAQPPQSGMEVTGARAMPARLQDKLLLHLFALTLHIDRFQSELSPLPSDLRLHQHKCVPVSAPFD